MSGTAAAAAPKVAKNVFTAKNINHVIFGCALGLACGFLLRKMLFVSKKSATVKA